ncbi:MAG: hypothetical protein GY922_13255 [Proteobacteria bacterium]|nr:hypothetical protein [Pseudomonadota bacterium]
MNHTEVPTEKVPKDFASDADDYCDEAVWVPALKEAAVAFIASALLLIVVYGVWFFDFHTEFQRFTNGSGATPLTLAGNQFVPVRAGTGGYEDGAAMIVEYLDGAAILAVKTAFQAEDYPFIAFDIDGLTTWSNAFVFWQLANEPGTDYLLPLNRSLDGVTQIAMPRGGSNYAGLVSSLAVGFMSDRTDHDNNLEVLHINSVTLKPYSAISVAEQIFEDWTNPPLWNGSSNNFVRSTHSFGIVSPNVFANLLVVIAVLLAWLWRLLNRHRGRVPTAGFLAVSLCLCLYGWAFNDILRWQWRIAQLADAHERYAEFSPEERVRNNVGRCGRRNDCFEYLLPYF